MAGTAVTNSVSRVWMDLQATGATGAIGNFSTATGIDASDLGLLVEDGSEIANPEITTEGFFVGDAATGASYTCTVRILGSTIDTIVSNGFTANPPTHLYLFFPNISLTRFSQIRGYCGEPFIEPASTTGKRTSWAFTFTAKGDAVSDFLSYFAATIIVPG